jgi:hypothetical protein
LTAEIKPTQQNQFLKSGTILQKQIEKDIEKIVD